MWEEDVGIVGVKMKFANTNRTGNGEGKPLCTYTCLYYRTIELKYELDSKWVLLSIIILKNILKIR